MTPLPERTRRSKTKAKAQKSTEAMAILSGQASRNIISRIKDQGSITLFIISSNPNAKFSLEISFHITIIQETKVINTWLSFSGWKEHDI